MSIISFSENAEGYLIPFEDKKALCDFSNPQEEAERWVASQNMTISNEIVLLGLGAGFHLRALKEARSYLKIHVIECRDQLLPIYKKQIQSQVENYSCFHSLEALLDSEVFETTLIKSLPVYFLRSSWGAQDDLFYSFWNNLTGRSVYAIAKHFASLGIEIDEGTLVSLKQSERPLTIKDATEIIIKSESSAAKESRGYFETLRELLR
ncbi:MAG TPA: hypothetical protein VIG33_03220 [Pseudobdellovibrionaceae bacterium]|jgi:hypothetical protein